MNKLFFIKVPIGEIPREWAKKYWDTYGFDYDPIQFPEPNTLLAWPYEIEEEELISNLKAGNIEFEIVEWTDEQLNRWFGL